MTLNFTVGPVQSEDYVCSIAAEQVPYFRNDYFSNIVLESESLIKKFVNAPEGSKVIFLTGSGTAAMESAVVNVFSEKDKLMVINGGTFGTRFTEICDTYGLDHVDIDVQFGGIIGYEDLENNYAPDITGLLVNVDETSSGVRYDMEMISRFCNEHNILLIADIISSFLADYNDMSAHNVDVYIIGSQKALACQPGISILVLSERAIDKIMHNNPRCYYLDLKKSLINAKRGQTPFTPAVGIIKQIHARLKNIDRNGGVDSEIDHVKQNADFIREHMKELPFRRVTEYSSNAVTAYYALGFSARDLFRIMKERYDIWICPNGGEYSDTVIRIGHIGNLTLDENRYLIDCLKKATNELLSGRV